MSSRSRTRPDVVTADTGARSHDAKETAEGSPHAFVPRRCTLEGFADEVSLIGGVDVAELEPITTLLVRTQNTMYMVVIVEPSERKILVQGGQFFAMTREARLNGSSFGGAFLKIAWIGLGLRMEICCDGRRIVTSPVRAIGILENASLPVA